MRAPLPACEAARLKILRGLQILDTPREAGFDVFAHAARKEAQTEIGLVSLVDDDRQWFKASAGLDVDQTSRDYAFCAYAILSDKIFCVEDAMLDERFRDNPLVVGEPHIRAYAGAPIIVDGHAIGTVCVISTQPRSFSSAVQQGLQHIAAAAADRMVIARQLQLQSRLLHTAGDAVVVADNEGRITFWNKAAERIFGYSAEEAMALLISDLVPERLRAQHDAGAARIRAGAPSKLEGKPVELPGLHRAGHEIPVELTLSLWVEGGERCFGAILRDCRERKALEEARAFSQATDRFLANMSHEIRTPLNGLLGLAQALRLTALDAHQSNLLRLMSDSGFMLERVLGDVLDAARMRAGDVETVLAPCDLSTVLGNVVDTHAPSARSKGLDYHAVIPHSPTWVSTDATRLSQIMTNLISNAIKFTSSGAVRIEAREQVAGTWLFEVRDTGIGFSADAAERIFDRFRQEDETITKRFGGSGLGLSIARDLAHALGGELNASALSGQGAVFVLTMPLTACAPPEAVDEQAPGEQSRFVKVLLAEDHAVNRKVVQLLLEPTGAELTMVEDGALAVEAFKHSRYDVVLMDMHMPVMDGLTAIAKIRTFEQGSGSAPTRIIALTANAFEEQERAALAAGADAHLTKPIVASVLINAIFDTARQSEDRLTLSA